MKNLVQLIQRRTELQKQRNAAVIDNEPEKVRRLNAQIGRLTEKIKGLAGVK